MPESPDRMTMALSDAQAEIERLRSALSALVDALAENDEDGLTEFAEPMIAARAALAEGEK